MISRSSHLFVFNRRDGMSLQLQLAANVKRLIHSGVLRPGKALPSTRELSRDLQISRNTVVQSYDRLIGEGYLEASPRRGVYVSELLNVKNLRAKPEVIGRQTSGGSVPIEGRDGRPVPFRPCQPDVRLFPVALWNRARTQALRKHGAALLRYRADEPLGWPPLRQALAEYLMGSRGVRCDWRQIAITSGSQQALFLLAQLLLKPRDVVAMEDPGYLGARAAWQYACADIHPIPVDGAGMNLNAIEKETAAKIIYTTPSRQFPTGCCLSLPRRLALVQFAVRHKAWLIEDDYDSEFRYSREPLPSLQSLDGSGRVIYVGSTSKVLFPSLRIGYIVLPAELIEKFAVLRVVVDEHGPVIDQATLAEFIECGGLFRHIRRARKEYGLRLEAFLDAARKFGVPVHFPNVDGGMNIAGFLQNSEGDAEVSRKLQQHGVEAPPLSRYSLRKTAPGLLFGFTAFEPPAIRSAMESTGRTLSGRRRATV